MIFCKSVQIIRQNEALDVKFSIGERNNKAIFENNEKILKETYRLERSERLKGFWSTYHLERSERLKEFWATYYLQRSERLEESLLI